jgi:thiol:disulfide interchange protein DsbA
MSDQAFVATSDPRRRLLGQVSGFCALFAGMSMSGAGLVISGQAAAATAREGADYRVLQTQAPLESTDRLDVLGFFWFGCPHCFTLEPALKAWVAKLPADVAFRKVHVPWRDQLQQLYYSLEALNKLALVDKVFEAIHKDKVNLQNSQQMADWIARQGVDAKSFQDAFDSFGVRTRMKRAGQLAEAYRLEGVPAIGVAGKYLTAPSMAGSNQQALAVAEELLAIERRNRRSAKS